MSSKTATPASPKPLPNPTLGEADPGGLGAYPPQGSDNSGIPGDRWREEKDIGRGRDHAAVMNDEEERYVDVLNQVAPVPIQLIDHTEDEQDQAEGGWAKDVQIEEYNVIEGSTRAGAYVVWVINIETWNGGGTIKICKRYSEFVTFRENLIREFPTRANEIPQLPPKSIISRFQAKFLQQRKQGLQYFLLCVLLNPTFASSSVVRDFVRS